MKKQVVFLLFSFLLICCMSLSRVNGQINSAGFSDIIVGSQRSLNFRVDNSKYIPNTSTSVKYVRINIHFLQKNDGTGNFSEISDGITTSSTYTGYVFAKKIIEMANYRIWINEKSNLPPNNTIPKLDPKYQFALNGVFFHKDDANYQFGTSQAVSKYSVESDRVINVFFEGKGTFGASAWANMSSPCFIEMNGVWDQYKGNTAGIDGLIWVQAECLMHEAGHNMGLYHTLMDGGGTCNLNAEDFCSDTPTGQEMISIYGATEMCKGSKVVCGWVQTGPFCSNNLMDYSGFTAITPQQLGRIHYALSSYMLEYNVCRMLSSDLFVDVFLDNQILFAGQNVNIPSTFASGKSMVLKKGQSKTIIYNNTVVLNPGFEVELGAELDVSYMVNSCSNGF